MPKFVQEKYQVTVGPYDDERKDHGWVTDKDARAKKGTPGREGRPWGDPTSRSMDNAVFYNSLPPGMDIDDQELIDSRVFNESVAGNDSRGRNAGDVTRDLTKMSAKTGYDRKECCGTDDMYTREHHDAFYDSPRVDGQEGFVERNNMLDRL